MQSLNENYSKVSELLDKLMVLSFEHLESCQNAGRLDEVCHQLVIHQHIFPFISFLCGTGRCIHLFLFLLVSVFCGFGAGV